MSGSKCRIISMALNGDYKSVKCIHEGHPKYFKEMLKSCYNTKKKVEDLINKGHFTFLEDDIDSIVPMARMIDVGNLDIFEDLNNENLAGADYIYLYNGNSWYYKKGFFHEGKMKFDKVNWEVV